MTDRVVVKMLTIDKPSLDRERLVVRFAENKKILTGLRDDGGENPVSLDGLSIDDYVRRILKSDLLIPKRGRGETSPFQPAADLDPKNTPPSLLDIGLHESVYLVFLLDPNWNWQFNRSGNCFRLSSPVERARNMYYNDVTHTAHVDGTFEKAGQWDDPIGNGCMAVHLLHKFRRLRYSDKFNLHVELLNGPEGNEESVATGIIIDPDVQNCPTCSDG